MLRERAASRPAVGVPARSMSWQGVGANSHRVLSAAFIAISASLGHSVGEVIAKEKGGIRNA